MEIKTILVPTDFSELSNEAVDFALKMAARLSAEVFFLHVLEWSDSPDKMTPLYQEGYTFIKERVSAFLNDLVERARAEGLEAGAEMASGVPSVEIIRMARKKAADLIILGTHGRTGLAHVLIGSQAERVVRHSPCPVLTVKSRRHPFTPI